MYPTVYIPTSQVCVYMDTYAAENISFLAIALVREPNALCGRSQGCTCRECFNGGTHVLRLSQPPLLSFPTLHYFLPVWMSSAECVSGLKGPSSWAEQLSYVTFSPLLCISGSLLYFGLACLQGSLISPPPNPCSPFVPPTQSILLLHKEHLTLFLSPSCLPLFL